MSCPSLGGRRRRRCGSFRAPEQACARGSSLKAWVSADLIGGSVRSALDRDVRGRGAGQTCLEAENRLRMELRDAGLGDPEHLADLAEGELLVVVEGDH